MYTHNTHTTHNLAYASGVSLKGSQADFAHGLKADCRLQKNLIIVQDDGVMIVIRLKKKNG